MSRKKKRKNVIASIFHVTVPDLKAQPLTRGLNVAKRGPFGKHMVAGTISAVDHRGPGVFFLPGKIAYWEKFRESRLYFIFVMVSAPKKSAGIVWINLILCGIWVLKVGLNLTYLCVAKFQPIAIST